MKLGQQINKNCNIYFPRSLYSLFLILSKKNSKDDNFVIINNFNKQKIPKNIILLLKKKKFKIILVNKNYSYSSVFNKEKNLKQNFYFIRYIKNLNNISNKILKTKYNELSEIKFENYYKINIYYSSDIYYFSNLYKNFNNINFYFLEHGTGNFLSYVYENYVYKNSYKFFIKRFIYLFFFKMKKISIPDKIFYFGISGNVFNLKKLNNDYDINFLNLDYKEGFNELYNFYLKKLSNIKKKKLEYLYLQLPHAYDFIAYTKFIGVILKKISKKKNSIVLVKLKSTHSSKNNIYNRYLLKILKKSNIEICLLGEKFKYIPAEVIIKFFNVKEIYSATSTILFSSSYFYNKHIKINAFFSNSVRKKYGHFIELKPFSNELIKNKYKRKDFIMEYF